MSKFDSQRALDALMAALFLVAGCGGGDDAPQRITFTVSAVVPNVSTGINGGDVVTIQGTNFLAVNVTSVTFGGSPGILDRNSLTDTSVEVRTPPAPLRNPGVVIVEVTTVEAGSKFVPGDYTYVSSSGSPQPQTISPTTFTPTGAQDFTIQGTNLGPSGGNVGVLFSGLGSVQGLVSLDATLVTGRAPVSTGTPPTGPVTVTINTGTDVADVPTTVTYDYTAPVAVAAPWQEPNGASRPVPLGLSNAVMCTSGVDNIWGNANDDVLIIQGPPTPVATRVTFPGGGSVGFLDRNNSIPVVLDANTICVYSVGPNGGPDGPGTATPDDTVVLITSAQTTPVVVPPLALGRLIPAPPARISSSTFAFIEAGADRNPGTADDWVRIHDTAFLQVGAFQLANPDVTPGRTNFSIPFSPDGDNVFVMSAGGNGTPSDGDDQLTRYVVSTGASTVTAVAFAQTRPHAISPTLLVAPGAGADAALGIGVDDLIVITTTPFALNVASHTLPTPIDTTAVVPLAPLGAGGVALPVQGPQPLLAFTNPVTGTNAALSLIGTPLLAPLGSGDLAVFTAGSAAPGDERAIRLLGDASSFQNFSVVPTLNQAIVVLTDDDRAFGVTIAAGSALLVHQTRALGAFADTSALPVDLPPATLITGLEPFVPVGANWGLVQTPGSTGLFRDGADAVLVVRY
ncbi:MAG: IPT/TIG domain-containing protein [Planctomycetota bacterium]|jgi:hypothetical protein